MIQRQRKENGVFAASRVLKCFIASSLPFRDRATGKSLRFSEAALHSEDLPTPLSQHLRLTRLASVPGARVWRRENCRGKR